MDQQDYKKDIFEAIDFVSAILPKKKYLYKKTSLTNSGDFVGDNFIIECKGRANESFPIRWKLFKAYVHKHLPNITLYKPQNQKECEETVSLILSSRKT